MSELQQQPTRYYLNGTVPSVEEFQAMTAAEYKANAIEVVIPAARVAQMRPMIECVNAVILQKVMSVYSKTIPEFDRLDPPEGGELARPSPLNNVDDVRETLAKIRTVVQATAGWTDMNWLRAAPDGGYTALILRSMLTELTDDVTLLPSVPVLTAKVAPGTALQA